MECMSCNRKTKEGVKFPCPACGSEIRRCDRCKKLSIEYKCESCGKVGP